VWPARLVDRHLDQIAVFTPATQAAAGSQNQRRPARQRRLTRRPQRVRSRTARDLNRDRAAPDSESKFPPFAEKIEKTPSHLGKPGNPPR